VLRKILITSLTCACALAQQPDAVYKSLERAYEAVRARDYDQAIAGFERAIAGAPSRADIRKDLAYTLLKIGENEAARDQFADALQLDPSDQHVALEYAFLCYETKQQAQARRIFDRIRKTGDATAEQAFQNIDRPLADGIARWLKALELSPDNFSAHRELATMAEQRDELLLAAEHFEKAFRLRPDERELLLDLGRVWKALGRAEQAHAALLAASRGAQPRVAEEARELLPSRYPYVYEFESALKLDPNNVQLRRELAYLQLEMGHKDAAEREFEVIHQSVPEDLLSAAQLGFLKLNRNDPAGARPLLDQVLQGNDDELADRVRAALKMPQTLKRNADTSRNQVSLEAKTLAEKSLKAGYLKDAVNYLTVAHESDPVDFWVMLKLGWAYNILHNDGEAVKWFKLASSSPDPSIADEATQSYNNLRPGFERFRTTAWAFPFFSSRWKDGFGYGQIKTDLKIGSLPFRPYLSTRLVGDIKRSATTSFGPQYLSETSLIFAIGVATTTWHGGTGWFEAGEAVKYLPNRKDVGSMIPDYRGGLSYAKGFGHLLNGSHGWFAETNNDGVFVSRFSDDFLLYSQNRTGYTFARSESLGFQGQFYWNYNATTDRLHQYWANFVETGPGVRFKMNGLPKSMLFSINFLRGAYLINDGNPRRPNYFDLRAGFWYAFTH
jgi:Tfp pilus assembly protein PilF